MTATPNTTVTRPSKRNKYCHPLRPCEPDIVSKAYAKSPLKTPERLPKTSVEDQFDCSPQVGKSHSQKYRSLIDSSSGRYQYVSWDITAGNMPASNCFTGRQRSIYGNVHMKKAYQSEKKSSGINSFFVVNADMREECNAPRDHYSRLPNTGLESFE